MKKYFLISILSVCCACEAPEGTINGSGNVTKVDGDTVIVSAPFGATPLRLSGPSPEQQKTAQNVCTLKGKTAKYISYNVRTEDYGPGLRYTGFYDLMFLCH